MSQTTLTHPQSLQHELEDAQPAWALVILWYAEDPGRSGELFLIPEGLTPGPFVLGRGASALSDPAPRLQLYQQRPGALRATLPLESRLLSRVQLQVTPRADALLVENVGRAPLRVGGRETQRAEVTRGDVLELGLPLLLWCVRRPQHMSSTLGSPLEGHAFGEPDAHGIVGEADATWRLRQRIEFVATADTC